MNEMILKNICAAQMLNLSILFFNMQNPEAKNPEASKLNIWERTHQPLEYCKLGRITGPRLAIRQKLAASKNICVWTYEKRPRVISLESESNTCILDEYGEY